MSRLRVCILSEDTGTEPIRIGRRSRKAPRDDREEIFAALSRARHEPFFHVLDGTPETLLALAELNADLVFNLTEAYGGDDTREMNVAALLELLDLRFTGAGPQGLYLAQDKALAKKLLAFHGIRTPFFASVHRGRAEWIDDLQFPLIVKPALEDGSIGIGFDAVVGSVKQLIERIDTLHAEFDTPVLVEEYIEGREIYAAVIGNAVPKVLPIIELDLSQLPEGTPRVAGTEVKWEEGTEIYRITQPFFPEDLDDELVAEIERTAIDTFRILKLRDYGRFDLRLTPSGAIYVLEANPNPWLHSSAELARSWVRTGRTEAELALEIVHLAMARDP